MEFIKLKKIKVFNSIEIKSKKLLIQLIFNLRIPAL